MPTAHFKSILAALAAGFFPAHLALAEGLSPCNRAAPQMQNTLGKKLKAGIPFELVAIVEQNGRAVCHQSLQLHFSLWDNLVRITDGNAILGRFSENEYSSVACTRLFCTKGVNNESKLRLRIFVNPNWAGRFARIQARTSSVSQVLFSLNWSDLTKNINKDETLFDEEFIP